MVPDQTTLATLDELRGARGRERAESDHLTAQAAELDADAEDRLADAGAHLVPRRAWWRVPAEVTPRVAEAERLVARVSALDERLARLQESGRTKAGWLRWTHAMRWTAARWERDRAASQLRTALVTIAQVGGPTVVEVPDVEPILEQAAELQARARHLRSSLASIARRLSDLDREIQLREQAERIMGFDSLHMAVHYSRYGLPLIDSPFELEAGEEAYLATDASLARLPAGSRYTRSGPGFTPSADHTGIHPWIGALRDRPAPAGTGTDSGVLFLSSLRLAFAGRAESVAIWLDAMVDMDVYRDAIAVVHLGADSPIILRVPAPRQVAFHINWAMRSALALERRPVP